MLDPFTIASSAARELQQRTGVERHDLVVVLGSGWARVADLLPSGTEVDVGVLPGFADPSVRGHAGVLRSVAVGPARVLLALGRVHLYEGHAAATVVHGIRTAAAAGCRIAVLTNAAGIINPAWPTGTVVALSDQLNFTGASPLSGAEFVDLTELYSPRLRAVVQQVEPGTPEGVYVGVHGPEFESPAEIRAYRTLGADLVGMSTVLEAIAARHLGMEVLGLALGTNQAAGVGGGPIDTNDVWEVGDASAPRVGGLLARVIERLAADGG
ncbi:MAG: purine-nucleoside phosphorylase [Acidimicrobiales bacterium]